LTCLRTKSSLEPKPEGNKNAGGQSQSGRAERPRRVAPVVKVAETPRCLVVVVPLFKKIKKKISCNSIRGRQFSPPDVQFVDRVIDVVRQLDVFGRRPAAFVVVGGNIGAERLDGAQTVPCYNFVGCGNLINYN
jgi:hypothetical protein